MIFEGYIVQMGGNERWQIHTLTSNIASSINQIAVRVNSTGKIYDNDIAEIKDGMINSAKNTVLRLIVNKL